MQTIYMVIVDCGDGSNSIEWHKTWSNEKLEKLEKLEQYQSGDGVQMQEIKVPNVTEFGAANNIEWFEDMVEYDVEDDVETYTYYTVRK